MNEDEFRIKVAQNVAQGGWSSIFSLVELVPIRDLRDAFCHLEEDEEE